MLQEALLQQAVSHEMPSRSQQMEIKPVGSKNLRSAAALLYHSYYDDPLFMEIFKADRPDYDKRLKAAIFEEVKVFWQSGESVIGLFVGHQLMGVACVISPHFGLSVGRVWHWRLKMLMTAGFVSSKQLISKEEKIRKALGFERYHTIAFLAIHPNHQQNGLGNRLIQTVDDLVESDPRSAGMAVYVTLDKYLAFFKSFDYEYVSELSVGYVKGKLLFRHSPLSAP